MTPTKYVAAGFMQDANKLLKDFLTRNSVDFKTFSEVWRNHNFSYIFMGRPDARELREFMHEIYQLTLNCVMSPGEEFQIGAVYLLYALYLNQNVVAPVNIRVTQVQFQVFQRLLSAAKQSGNRSLQYIIEFLCKNSLEFVAASSLYGPCCSINRNDLVKPKVNAFEIFSELKQNMMSFQEKEVFDDLKTLHSQYLNKKASLQPQTELFDVLKQYDKFEADLDSLLSGSKRTKSKVRNVPDDIGIRRTRIKNASFQKRAMFRILNLDEDTNVEPTLPSSSVKKTKIVRKRRIPPEKRRVGRPRKHPQNGTTSEESEKEHSPPPVIALPTTSHPKRRGPIGRKKTSYLKDYVGPISLTESKQKKPTNEEVYDLSDDSSVDLRF